MKYVYVVTREETYEPGEMLGVFSTWMKARKLISIQARGQNISVDRKSDGVTYASASINSLVTIECRRVELDVVKS